jgi:hypothetical protein
LEVPLRQPKNIGTGEEKRKLLQQDLLGDPEALFWPTDLSSAKPSGRAVTRPYKRDASLEILRLQDNKLEIASKGVV